jgi:hypothetical protein
VYEGYKLIFASTKDRLLPLMEYIGTIAPAHQGIAIMDKIMGNAAALLSIKAGCREVYSPLGSQLALQTLCEYNIEYHLIKVVPYIQNADGSDMCPMEKLSIGKVPEEFYREMQNLVSGKTFPDG